PRLAARAPAVLARSVPYPPSPSEYSLRPSPPPKSGFLRNRSAPPFPHASPIPPSRAFSGDGPCRGTPNLGFPVSRPRAGSRSGGTPAMLPCARSVLRRRGLASSLLRRCGGEAECAAGTGEGLANARRASTIAALGGGRVLGRGGRWADPRVSVMGAGRTTRTQTRCFLGCGDGEEGSVLSKVYEERRVMGYSPKQMFAVVAAVDLYEDFVPWCQRSRIIRRYDDGSLDAELEIGFKFLVESYVSHVEMEKPKYIKSTASESGLFDHLINVWEFKPGPAPGTCDLYFLVDFKFQSPLYRQVASMFFKEVASRLVSSLSDRCLRIYGPPVPVVENTYGQGR
ncbi:unnamed protein product, partial [Urochloa humidicola]